MTQLERSDVESALSCALEEHVLCSSSVTYLSYFQTWRNSLLTEAESAFFFLAHETRLFVISWFYLRESFLTLLKLQEKLYKNPCR